MRNEGRRDNRRRNITEEPEYERERETERSSRRNVEGETERSARRNAEHETEHSSRHNAEGETERSPRRNAEGETEHGSRHNTERETKHSARRNAEGETVHSPRRNAEREIAYGPHHTPRKKRKQNRKKLPGWAIIPILIAVALICFGASKAFGGGTKAAQLKVVQARRESIKEVYNTSGTVVSEKTKTFYSPVNAPVKKNKAKVGKAVKKGDTLVTFDTSNLDRDNQTSKLNTLSAQYTAQDAKEQSGRTQAAAGKAKKQEEAMIAELKSQIKKKQSEIKKLEKQAGKAAAKDTENASKAAAIQQQMAENLDSQSICKAKKENAERQLANLDELTEDMEQTRAELVKEAEDATNEISRLEREYRILNQKLKQLGGAALSGSEDGEDGNAGSMAGSAQALQSLAQAKQELEALRSSLTQAENGRQITADTGLSAAQLKNMQVSEDLAKLSELTTKELLLKGKKGIKAEFDGIISDVKAVEGSDAVQGGELFTLVSNRDVSVELEVSAGDFENLTEGGSAVITIGRRRYQGTVESVNKIALPNDKGNPVIGAKLHIDDPDDEIFIGVSAKVAMTVAEKADALCLPNEVINTGSAGDFVYVIKNGTVMKRKVEVGVASASMSEIISGISEDDEVVSEISDNIKEGMKAAAIKEEAGKAGAADEAGEKAEEAGKKSEAADKEKDGE